jgi:hypothetical protein
MPTVSKEDGGQTIHNMDTIRLPPELLYSVHGYCDIDTRLRLQYVLPGSTSWRHHVNVEGFCSPLKTPNTVTLLWLGEKRRFSNLCLWHMEEWRRVTLVFEEVIGCIDYDCRCAFARRSFQVNTCDGHRLYSLDEHSNTWILGGRIQSSSSDCLNLGVPGSAREASSPTTFLSSS